jgi:hypothetical protein
MRGAGSSQNTRPSTTAALMRPRTENLQFRMLKLQRSVRNTQTRVAKYADENGSGGGGWRIHRKRVCIFKTSRS